MYPFRIFIKAKLCIYLFVYVFIHSRLRFKCLLNQKRNTELTNNYKMYSIYTPIVYFCSSIHYLVYSLQCIRIQELAAIVKASCSLPDRAKVSSFISINTLKNKQI